MNLIRLTIRTLLAATLVTQAIGASAQEAAIRKNLAERLPNLPRIDEAFRAQSARAGEWRVVIKRRNLLSYLRTNNLEGYRALIAELGLRK